MQTLRAWIERVYADYGPWAVLGLGAGVTLLVIVALWALAALIGVDVAGAINGWLR